MEQQNDRRSTRRQDAVMLLLRRRWLAVGVGAFVALFSLMCLWSLSSPLMSGPDENAHMIKAGGVAYGQPSGVENGVPGTRSFEVPTYFAQAGNSLCYVFRENQPASCITDIDGSNDERALVVSAAGGYNPVYYALVGWPSLFLEDEAAFHAMRGASALIVSLVMASGFGALAARSRSGWSLTAAVVAVTPMTLFLGGTVNPSSLEFASGFALACWLSLLCEQERPMGPAWPIVGAVVTAALLVNTRSVGVIWALAIIVVFFADPRVWRRLGRRWQFWVGVAAIGAATAFALLWAQAQGAAENRVALAGAGETPFLKGFEYMLAITLQNAGGYIGVFGWLDAPLPPTAVSVWGGLMVALVVAAFVYGRGWDRVKVVLMTAAFVLLPAIVQGASWNELGYIWQARYILAVLLALLVVAGAALDSSVPQPAELPRARTLAITLTSALAIIQVFGFLWALKRYVTGLMDGKGWTLMLSDPMWQPPLTWPVLAGAAATVTVLAYAGYVLLTTRRPAPAPTAGTGRDDDADAPARTA